jgi:hypothetical protein
MSYFRDKSNRWIILFLVVLNIATLSFMWINRPVPQNRPGAPTPPAGLLARELGFDKEQADALKPVMDDYFMSTDSIREQLQKNRQALLASIKDEPLNNQQIDRLLAENEALHTRENRAFIEHYRGIMRICSEVQKEQLAKIFSRPVPPPPGRRPR